MKKFIGLVAILVTLSCNDKLWDELDRVEYINEAQATALRELRVENQNLSDALDTAEQQLTELIDSNTESIIDNVNSIADTNEDIVAVLGAIDSIQYDIDVVEYSISTVADSLQSNIDSVNDLLESEVIAIQDLIKDGDKEIILAIDALQQQVDSIQPVINNFSTNITEITTIEDNYDDSQIQSDLRELFCDANETFGEYVLPPYNNTSRWIGIYDKETQRILIDSIKRVQFGEYPDWTFRHMDENGWVGVFGQNYLEAELPEYDYANTYQEANLSQEPQEGHPSLGEIQAPKGDVVGDIAFEFDESTGEYGGCATEDVVWYVNGVEADKGANAKFDVGDLKGDYVITIKFPDGGIAQHLVTVTNSISAKAAKKKGRIVVRRPV